MTAATNAGIGVHPPPSGSDLRTTTLAGGGHANQAGIPGRLVPYGSNNLCYFEFQNGAGRDQIQSGSSSPSTSLVLLIPGLSEGLLGLPSFEAVAAQLTSAHHPNNNNDTMSTYRVVQPLLRSSYGQFGFRSCSTDVEDLMECLETIVLDAITAEPPTGRDPFEELVLIGHSTGCQDIVQLLRTDLSSLRLNGRSEPGLDPGFSFPKGVRCILQAAVSDREAIIQDAEPARVEEVLHLLAEHADLSRGEQDLRLVPPELALAVFESPIMTVGRARDLLERRGADDFFSTDFTEDELWDTYLPAFKGESCVWSGVERLSVRFILSPKDEYAVLKTRGQYREFLARVTTCLQNLADLSGGGKSGGKRFHAAFDLYEGSHNCSEDRAQLDALLLGAVTDPGLDGGDFEALQLGCLVPMWKTLVPSKDMRMIVVGMVSWRIETHPHRLFFVRRS